MPLLIAQDSLEDGSAGIVRATNINHNAAYQSLRVVKTETGLVIFTGFVENGTGALVNNNTTIVTLPVGFRPAVVAMIPVASSAGFRCDLAVNGEVSVKFDWAAGNWVWFNGIFEAA